MLNIKLNFDLVCDVYLGHSMGCAYEEGLNGCNKSEIHFNWMVVVAMEMPW